MREEVEVNLKVIQGKKEDKFDAKANKMTSPIQRVLLEINKEKVKKGFSVADAIK